MDGVGDGGGVRWDKTGPDGKGGGEETRTRTNHDNIPPRIPQFRRRDDGDRPAETMPRRGDLMARIRRHGGVQRGE